MDTPYLTIWRETVKNYLQKGGKFKKIPKKNTCEYYKCLSDYRSALLKSNVLPKPKIATGAASQ